MSHRTLLLALSIAAFTLGAIAAGTGDPVIWNALTWTNIGGGFLAGGFL